MYYTYTTNGAQYEVTAVMESQKYGVGGSSDVITPDGGALASVYEKGTKLGLEPMDYGDPSLIGFWPLDEGSTALRTITPARTRREAGTARRGARGHILFAGKIGPYTGTFDGTSTYVGNVANNAAFTLTNGVTMVAWIKLSGLGVDRKIISKRPSYVLTVYNTNVPETEIFIGGSSQDTRSAGGGTVLTTGVWYQIAGTFDGSTVKTYVNGVLDRQVSASGILSSTTYAIDLGKTADGTNNYFNGLIDDARVYNRALSAANSPRCIGGK